MCCTVPPTAKNGCYSLLLAHAVVLGVLAETGKTECCTFDSACLYPAILERHEEVKRTEGVTYDIEIMINSEWPILYCLGTRREACVRTGGVIVHQRRSVVQRLITPHVELIMYLLCHVDILIINN